MISMLDSPLKRALTLTVLIILAGAACRHEETTRPPTITEGSTVLKAVHFPAPWAGQALTASSPEKIVDGHFKVKRHAARPGYFLFGVRSTQGFDSRQHYVVDFQDDIRLTTASDDEWDHGSAMELSLNLRDPLFRNNEFAHQEIFKPTGASHATALLSPNRQWLSVVSETNTEEAVGDGLFKRGKYVGTVYLDLYDVVSGKRLAGAEWPYSGTSYTLEDTGWLDDVAFLLPLGTDKRWCLVAIPATPTGETKPSVP